jgi:DNA-binding PadR family transcriptional regulator
MNNKELLKGTLITIILKLLDEHGKMYGYEIAQKVKERSNDRILLKDGSLYPALHKLEEDGLVTHETMNIGKRVRKYYLITEKGKSEKVAALAELRAFIETIKDLVYMVAVSLHSPVFKFNI